MDMKHRMAYARIKLTGVSEPVVHNDGMSLTMLMREIMLTLSKFPSRYNDIQIDISFDPIGHALTQQEKDYREMLTGLDLGDIPLESDEEAALWANSPINPQSDSYDPLLFEYRQCSITAHRQRKTPEDLALLRKHVESKYASSPHWNGSHYW